jgi:hypothetical protein
MQANKSRSVNLKPMFKDGYPKLNIEVSNKVGGDHTIQPSHNDGKLACFGELQIMPSHQGKKLINYSNYTLNQDNIINAKNLTADKFYSTYLKEQVMDYKKDIMQEMKQDLQKHMKLTQNLKSIHPGHGSYHLPPNPNSKLSLFRGQNIFVEDYKQILRDR